MGTNTLSFILNKDVTSYETHFSDDSVFGSSLGRVLRDIPIYGSYTVTQETAGNPAAISSLLYNTCKYDWVIMMINHVTVEQLKVGTRLLVPPISAITNYLSK